MDPLHRASSGFPKAAVPVTRQVSKASGVTSQAPQHRSQPQWPAPLPSDATHRMGVWVMLGTM